LAGVWIAAVAGFDGMRDRDGALSFTPHLPARLTRLAFGLCFRDRRLKVKVAPDQARYPLLECPPLQITHHGQAITITRHEAESCSIPRVPHTGESPGQRSGRRPARRKISG